MDEMRLFTPKKLVIFFCILTATYLLINLNYEVISYVMSYVEMIIDLIVKENERRAVDFTITADTYWRHYQFQVQYKEKICESRIGANDKYLWLTALVNDEYAIPAVVLGYSIRSLSCITNMIAFTSNEVTQPTREALAKVGWQVKVVTAMDCRWMEKRLGKAPSGKGIKGTHTRFHAWNYTQYHKIIYTDPDWMPLTNTDELFEVKSDFAATYCGRPGLVDPCFNAGLLVFRPSLSDFQAIMDIWLSKSQKGSCPDDQRLLYYHYAFHGKWKPLPFAYNVRRIIHYPMKAFHFVCCPPKYKPWKAKCRPSRDEARSFNQGITTVRDVTLVYWKKFYAALKKYHLDNWYRSTKYYNAEMEFGKHLYKDCWEEFY